MDARAELREGVAVFDAAGRRLGHVEALRDGHFFLTHKSLVTERIVVDARASVASVDADGVHLRHGREDLLSRQMRPPEVQSSRQIAPGEDATSVRRGDEDRRGLAAGDPRQQRKDAEGPTPA